MKPEFCKVTGRSKWTGILKRRAAAALCSQRLYFLLCSVPTEDRHHYLVEGKRRDFADVTGTCCRLGIFHRDFRISKVNVTRLNAPACHKTAPPVHPGTFKTCGMMSWLNHTLVLHVKEMLQQCSWVHF